MPDVYQLQLLSVLLNASVWCGVLNCIFNVITPVHGYYNSKLGMYLQIYFVKLNSTCFLLRACVGGAFPQPPPPRGSTPETLWLLRCLQRWYADIYLFPHFHHTHTKPCPDAVSKSISLVNYSNYVVQPFITKQQDIKQFAACLILSFIMTGGFYSLTFKLVFLDNF